MSTVQPSAAVWMRDFSPGYLDSPESDTIPHGATPDARNEEFTSIQRDGGRRAIIRKRRGSRLLNPVVTATQAKGDGLFEFRRINSAGTLLAMFAGSLYAFDDVDTFTSVGSGWTALASARLLMFKNQGYLTDGTYQRRYDGTSLWTIGFPKPSSVTDMTASGTGVTGDYDSLYTWYDSATDHESSPSDSTTVVTFTNQSRVHTKPGGSPPANVTHWRAYVRRDDTHETRWFRVGTVVVGTSTLTESVSDALRVEPAPSTSSNDEPPVFKVLGEYKGFGIGVTANDDAYYVSKQGDFESWHPKDKFRVPGGTEDLRCGTPYGSEFILQKPHASWRLVGDQLPFVNEPLHSAYGCVSPDGAGEADQWFYAWDRVRGPYRTDLTTWEPLADARIETIVSQLNTSAASDIRFAHDETNKRVTWAIPLGSQTRKRMLLKYSYLTDSWLPPDTGLEYGSLASFTAADGDTGLYMADHWGRVYQLYSGEREGVPVGSPTDYTVSATVTSATADTVTVSGGNFYTTGSGCAGMPVAVLSADGGSQWRRILSNTADTITLDTTNDTAWSTTPDASYQVLVGGIEWYHWTPWLDFGLPHLEKKLNHLYIQAKPQSDQHIITVRGRFNDDEGLIAATDFSFTVSSLAAIWDESEWDTALWSTTLRRIRKASVERAAFTVQFQVLNYEPSQPIEITLMGVTADVLARRLAPGAQET